MLKSNIDFKMKGKVKCSSNKLMELKPKKQLQLNKDLKAKSGLPIRYLMNASTFK